MPTNAEKLQALLDEAGRRGGGEVRWPSSETVVVRGRPIRVPDGVLLVGTPDDARLITSAAEYAAYRSRLADFLSALRGLCNAHGASINGCDFTAEPLTEAAIGNGGCVFFVPTPSGGRLGIRLAPPVDSTEPPAGQ
jgi:hypothetical protein